MMVLALYCLNTHNGTNVFLSRVYKAITWNKPLIALISIPALITVCLAVWLTEPQLSKSLTDWTEEENKGKNEDRSWIGIKRR